MTSLTLMGVALAALLSENMVLVTCMGIGTRRASFRDPLDAWRTGFSLTLVMVFTALFSRLADIYLLSNLGLQSLRTLLFSLLVLAVTALARGALRAFLPELSRRLDANLGAMPTNAAALGTALLLAQRGYPVSSSLVYALFGGLGAAVALMSFAGLREEIDLERCPRCFRGLPILFLTAGLMAMSLMGFYGLNLG